jgi:type II secretory pathway pseudopilin PulG
LQEVYLLTGTAPVNLPQRQMRLQFGDQVSLNASFAHWLETLIEPAPELRFSNARKALEALQANGSPSPLEAAYTDIQETTPQNRQRVVNIAITQYIIAFFCVIALPSMFAMVRKAKESEARNNIGAMNRAQQAYFLEQQEFSDSMAALGISIKPQTENYDYSIRATPLAVFNYATPRRNGLRGYVSTVYLLVPNEQTGEILTTVLICKTKDDGRSNWSKIPRPAEPPIIRENGIECGPKTEAYGLLGGRGPGHTLLDTDSALAYNSLSYATAGQYDKALEVAQSINNADLKARALATIAITLAEKGQYDKALEVSTTIKDGSIKKRTLDAIARYQKSP